VTLSNVEGSAVPEAFRLDSAHEIEELFCVPSENDAFNKHVRDPGAGVSR
jgi:hypothetical protein